MWLPRRLRSLLESLESASNLAGEVQQLAQAVRDLESLQTDREIQWTETKDQIHRHLKRAQAIRQRAEDHDPAAELRSQLIARKFPRTGG